MWIYQNYDTILSHIFTKVKAIFYDVERCKFNNAMKNYNPIYSEVKIKRKMKEQSRCKVRVPFMCSQLKVAGVDEYKT